MEEKLSDFLLGLGTFGFRDSELGIGTNSGFSRLDQETILSTDKKLAMELNLDFKIIIEQKS